MERAEGNVVVPKASEREEDDWEDVGEHHGSGAMDERERMAKRAVSEPRLMSIRRVTMMVTRLRALRGTRRVDET